MKKIICEEAMAFGLAAAEWCREKTLDGTARSIYVPAGQTPVALYRQWEQTNPAYLDRLQLLQIDDVLTGSSQGVFKDFFREYLPTYQPKIQFIDRADQQADLAVLGLGLNGHVAFHEPGLPADFYSGCVRLSETTVGHLKLERGTWGISYGAGAFFRCKSILFMVSGASKREVLARLLAGDPSLPASALLSHPDLTLVADRAALPTPTPSLIDAAVAGYGKKTKENEI